MPIVQISQIKHRRGLQENLPQLGSAEFGWSIDAQRLFIGSGTREEGAPTEENIEIITETSPLWISLQSQIETTEFTQQLDQGTTTSLTRAVSLLDGVVTQNNEDGFTSYTPSIIIKYQISRDNSSRTGIFKASRNTSTNIVVYDDDFTETEDMGITLIAEYDSGAGLNTAKMDIYADVTSGTNAIISYEIDVYTKNLNL